MFPNLHLRSLLMTIKNLSLSFVCGLALMFVGASLVPAQVPTTQASSSASTVYRSVPSGAKMKFQGVVIDRNADTFTIRDRTRTDYQVLITDNTSVKTKGGFLHGGKKDRKSTRLNSSHLGISYAVFCLKKKKQNN